TSASASSQRAVASRQHAVQNEAAPRLTTPRVPGHVRRKISPSNHLFGVRAKLRANQGLPRTDQGQSLLLPDLVEDLENAGVQAGVLDPELLGEAAPVDQVVS